MVEEILRYTGHNSDKLQKLINTLVEERQLLLQKQLSEEFYQSEIPVSYELFSIRTTNALKKAGIYTLRELAQYAEQDLLIMRSFGKKSLEEITAVLDARGLSLAGYAS